MRLEALTRDRWREYARFVDTAILAVGIVDRDGFLCAQADIAAALAERLEQELPGRTLLFPPLQLFDCTLLEDRQDGTELSALVDRFYRARRLDGFRFTVIVRWSPGLSLFRLAPEAVEGSDGLLLWDIEQGSGETLTKEDADSMALFLNAQRGRINFPDSENDTYDHGRASLQRRFGELLEYVESAWDRSGAFR